MHSFGCSPGREREWTLHYAAKIYYPAKTATSATAATAATTAELRVGSVTLALNNLQGRRRSSVSLNAADWRAPKLAQRWSVAITPSTLGNPFGF